VKRPFTGGRPRVPLAVLIVEGSDAAAELAVGALENDVYLPVRWRRVQDAAGMTSALREKSWDVVLSEHRIADFDAFKAIEVLGASGVEVPLIVVSGAIGEETAVGAIRAGAADFVSKNHLDRLGVVVARCLRHQVEDQRAREEAKYAASENRERFLASIETLIDPFVLLRPVRDEAGRIVDFVYEYANAAACDANILDGEDLVGMRVLERVTPLAPVGLFDAYATVVETSEPLALDDFASAGTDGETDRRFFDVRALKAVELLVLTWRDVTERDRAQAESARLAAIVRVSPDAIVFLDPDLRIASWNKGAEAIYGYAPEEVLGKSSDVLIPADATGESRGLRGRSVAGGEVRHYETQRLHKDGSLIDVAITAFAVIDAAGDVAGATTITRDITQRMRAERALAVSDERYREILDTTPDGVWRVDAENRTDYVNPRMASMLGYSPEEMIGRELSDFMDPEQFEIAQEDMARARRKGRFAVVENGLVRRDGTRCWVRVSHTALTDAHGRHTGGMAIMSDITASKAQAVELRASEHFLAALTDSMAEGMFAFDRDGHVTYMNQAAEKLLGWTKEELATRSMHDTTHHQHQDGSSYEAADCPLLCALRTGETVKVDDDVFTRRDGRLLPVAYSAAPVKVDEHVQGIVVVFGDVSVRKAEQLRHARQLETLGWVGRIRDALDEDRLVLYAQPIIDLHSRQVVMHELLLRMIDRDGAIIAPGRFLPAAEQFGLIEEIDRWVLAQAVKLAARGRKLHFNVSGKSLGSSQLIDELVRSLRDTGADPRLLVCEITETALANDESVAETFVHELSQLGCEIALDDFGVGYGGFAYLKRLPITVLKIDIQFVRDLPENPQNQHVVKAIVNLAQGFERQTIAEGAENQATIGLLEEYGVDYAQGYEIGRPAPIAILLDGDSSRAT
jgi:PAS domain S-box-containing protein